VYVSTRNATTDSNRIFALNAATGACVWVLNGSCSGATSTLNIGQISAVPLLDATNYRLLFTSLLYNAGSTVWAVDAHDSASGNRVLWSRNLGSIDSSLTFTSASRDAVLVGTNAGRIYKLDPSDGTTCWGQTSDGCAHAATGTEQFFCTDPAVNARATSCTNGAAIQKSLVPVNGTFLGNVVFSTTDGYVRMINSQGAQVWRTLVSGASTPLPLPSVSSGKVYVGGSDGLVHELSLSDGTQTGTRSVGGGTIVASAPAYDSTTGTLHLNTSQGSQYGFSVPF
jgi:outer membrane protein assembly factor BamB